jgi:hypothetical protein
MPDNQPVGTRRFIEQSGTKGPRLGTEKLMSDLHQRRIRRQFADTDIA